MMPISHAYQSPNLKKNQIPVEFIILHYTACDLETTLKIFMNPEKHVTAHFVIAPDGTCYDLGSSYQGPILQGAHAGISEFLVDGKLFKQFNEFSIGIELINLNGNLLNYTDAQYKSLAGLIRHFQSRFPQLKNPERILGHEHIAHMRGKVDPGLHFDWKNLFDRLNMSPSPVHRLHYCSVEDLAFLQERLALKPNDPVLEQEFWPFLSSELEARVAARLKSQTHDKTPANDLEHKK